MAIQTWLAQLQWAGKPIKRMNDSLCDNLREQQSLLNKIEQLKSEYIVMEREAEEMVARDWSEEEIQAAKEAHAASQNKAS